MQRTVLGRDCLHSPMILEKHSLMPSQAQTIHSKSPIYGTRGKRSNLQENTLNPDLWLRLLGRPNEDKCFIDAMPLLALLDTGSQVTQIRTDYCQEHGIQIYPIGQIVNIEEHGAVV